MDANQVNLQPWQTNLNLKGVNTITPKWPHRLKLQPNDQGAMFEFNLLMTSGHTGLKRYAEWQKTQLEVPESPLPKPYTW